MKFKITENFLNELKGSLQTYVIKDLESSPRKLEALVNVLQKTFEGLWSDEKDIQKIPELVKFLKERFDQTEATRFFTNPEMIGNLFNGLANVPEFKEYLNERSSIKVLFDNPEIMKDLLNFLGQNYKESDVKSMYFTPEKLSGKDRLADMVKELDKNIANNLIDYLTNKSKGFFEINNYIDSQADMAKGYGVAIDKNSLKARAIHKAMEIGFQNEANPTEKKYRNPDPYRAVKYLAKELRGVKAFKGAVIEDKVITSNFPLNIFDDSENITFKRCRFESLETEKVEFLRPRIFNHANFVDCEGLNMQEIMAQRWVQKLADHGAEHIKIEEGYLPKASDYRVNEEAALIQIKSLRDEAGAKELLDILRKNIVSVKDSSPISADAFAVVILSNIDGLDNSKIRSFEYNRSSLDKSTLKAAVNNIVSQLNCGEDLKFYTNEILEGKEGWKDKVLFERLISSRDNKKVDDNGSFKSLIEVLLKASNSDLLKPYNGKAAFTDLPELLEKAGYKKALGINTLEHAILRQEEHGLSLKLAELLDLKTIDSDVLSKQLRPAEMEKGLSVSGIFVLRFLKESPEIKSVKMANHYLDKMVEKGHLGQTERSLFKADKKQLSCNDNAVRGYSASKHASKSRAFRDMGADDDLGRH